MTENELIKDMGESKPNITKIETLLFIYGMTCSYIAKCLSAGKSYTEDPRKYRNIASGEYSRIEKDTLMNLCTFLGVSVDLALDGLFGNMGGSVYIHNQNKWISFDDFILLKTTRFVGDILVLDNDGNPKYIRHVIRKDLFDLNDQKNPYMLKFAKEIEPYEYGYKIYRPNHILIKNYFNCCKNEKKYEQLIKPYYVKLFGGDTKKVEFLFNSKLERIIERNAMENLANLFKTEQEEGSSLDYIEPGYSEFGQALGNIRFEHAVEEWKSEIVYDENIGEKNYQELLEEAKDNIIEGHFEDEDNNDNSDK